jgi:hypothetical protein
MVANARAHFYYDGISKFMPRWDKCNMLKDYSKK